MIIYKTINLINGKIYVGQDSQNNPKYLGSGTYLNKSIKKYGRENFKKEIIEYCETKEDLNEREMFWIKELNSKDREIGYNLTDGGNSTLGYKHTIESKIKMSINQKGKHNQSKTQEHKEKIGKANKGKIRSIEQRKNISKSKSKEKHPLWQKHLTEDCKNKIRDANKYRLFTSEHKERLSKSAKGRLLTESHKQKIKETLILHNSNKKRSIIQYDIQMNIIGEYESQSYASRETNINRINIMRCCNGITQSAGGYIWKYK